MFMAGKWIGIIAAVAAALLIAAVVLLMLDNGEQILTVRDDLREIMLNSDDTVIVDLRDNPDYEITHIESSVNLPLDDDGEWLLGNISKYAGRFSKIILVCYSGKRAALGCKLLKNAGYHNVRCVVADFEDIGRMLGYDSLEGAEICDCYR